MPSKRRSSTRRGKVTAKRAPSGARLCKACRGKTRSEGGANSVDLAKMTDSDLTTRTERVAQLKDEKKY